MEGDRSWRCHLDVDTLDCPICTEPLSAPVYQCENGHILCSACSGQVSVSRKGCPSCSRPTGRIRCLAIEKVLQSVLVSCEHRPHGCQKMLRYGKRDERDLHEERCGFQPLACPVASCSYQGPIASFSLHLTDAHGVKGIKISSKVAAFRMLSDENYMKLYIGASPTSSIPVDDDGNDVLCMILVHREIDGELGDWFFCTAYGLKYVKYKLRVSRRGGRPDIAVHKMKAVVHDSSRKNVRDARRPTDRMLVPLADVSQPWHFDVKISFCEEHVLKVETTHNPDDLLTHDPGDFLTHDPDDFLTHFPGFLITHDPGDLLASDASDASDDIDDTDDSDDAVF